MAQLRLLHTTDIHANLLGYDYFADTPTTAHSLARAASLIEQLRQQHPNCILLDGGDFLQGTPLADCSALEPHQDQPNPVIAAFNAMGYDAAALGNHDFGYGLGFLQTIIAQADFPILCANVFETHPPGRTFTLAKTIITRHLTVAHPDRDAQILPIKIGLFGVLPPQLVAWEHAKLAGKITTGLIADSAAETARDLRREGADLIIALSHSGISETDNMTENASLAVAAIDEVDVVFSGHTHQIFPGSDHSPSALVDPVAGTLCGKPAVMAGCHGSHVGQIDLCLRWSADGWHIASHKSRAIPVRLTAPQTCEAPAILSLLKPAHEQTLAYIRRQVGTLPRPLNSYFSAIRHDHALRLVAEAQRCYVQQALRHSADQDLPVISAAAPLKSGGRAGAGHFTNVAAGQITVASVADLYFFANDIAALRVSGTQLQIWLEMAAGRYCQLRPDQPDQPLLNEDFASYNADVLHGLTYEIDLSQPARFSPGGQLQNPQARRIRNLRFNAAPVTADQSFVVATNSYRANGGGHYPGLSNTESLALPVCNMRDVLAKHIGSQSNPLGPDLFGADQAAWKFTAMPGTSGIFNTSPRAEPLIPPLNKVEIAARPQAAGGFLKLRIHL